MTATPTPDNQTSDFLTNLFGIVDHGWLTLFAVHPDGQRTTRWTRATEPERLAAYAAELHECNVWFGCATRHARLDDGRRGGKDDVNQVAGLWVDIDIAGPGHATTNPLPNEDQAWRLVNAFPLPPTCIIHSGHGLQAWWALAEPHDLKGSDLLARWGTTWARRAREAGHHLDNVFDAPRIMRLPGTVNTKPGCPPVPVTIEHDDWRLRYGIDDIEQFLDEPLEPVVNHRGVPYIGPDRPGDAYNARHTTAEQLQALGFTPGRVDRDGAQTWKWPAAAGDNSATTFPDGHCAIWSETAANQLGVRTQWGYDPYGLYVDTQHRGDYSAASRHLAANGYGAPAVALKSLIAPGAPSAPPDASRWLPDDFWNARPYLTHIRQAAWARTTSPDAVLAALLTRIAATTKHQYAIPPIIGTAGSLNFYAAIIAPSGAGKSTSIGIADELAPATNILEDIAKNIPLGSGEGLAEAFMGEKDEEDDAGKKKKVRAQVRWNAHVVVDEGAAITAMMDRSGTTILETLRRGWSGQTLGQANASQDRRRIIHNYRLGLIVAFQPELAGRLLADHHAGTPQRFIYASGTDPNLPDNPPDWPGRLQPPPIKPADERLHEKRDSGLNQIHLGVDDHIVRTIRREQLEKARGDRTVHDLDSHEPMHRLKTAALLAILDGRLDITNDDWALADTIWTTSCAVRDWLTKKAAQAERDLAQAKAIRRAESAIVEDEHRATHDQRKAQRLARNIARHIHEKATPGGEWEHGAAPRDIGHILPSRDRHLRDDAIQTALDERLIVAVETDTTRYMPGPNQPA